MMIYYVIRHKATGELMPQMKRDRGYTHWNPNKGSESPKGLGIPRLFDRIKKANLSRKLWASQPNLAYRNDYNNEPRLDIKDDGRKLEDIEVIKVDLVLDNETS